MTGVLTPVGDFRVSTAVVTHRRRDALVSRLRRGAPDLRMTAHRGGSWETSPDDALSNVLSAWRDVPPGATHHLVLQDDVTLCPGFLDKLERALSGSPGGCFSMFCEWGSKTAQLVRMAALSGAGWATVADPWLPAPAVVMTAELACGFAAFLERRVRDGERRDAFLLLEYLAGVGELALVSVPNLVQHDVPLSTSLLPNGKVRGPRRAACLAGPGTPAPRPSVVRLPEVLPYHSPHDLAASVLSDWDGHYGWTTTPAFEWNASRGWSPFRTDEAVRAAIADAAVDLDDLPLGFDAIRESWLGAFTLGRVMADNGLEVRMGNANDAGGLAGTALRTLAAGTFRRVLAPRLLDAWSDTAVPLLAGALVAGATSSPPR